MADDPIRWRKIGGGSFRMANGKRIIKPNEVFEARPSEIPQGFRDVVVPLDGSAGIVEEEPMQVDSGVYEIAERGGGWFDVVNGSGKKMNEQPLRKDKAEELIGLLAD